MQSIETYYARALEYRYITPSGLPPECALSHAARMMLLMGMLRERREKEGQPMAEGTKTVETEKTPQAIRRRSPLGVSKIARSCRSTPLLRIAVGERGARRVRARGSFVRDIRDAISVVTTHSVRSLTRSPAPRPPRGGLDRERPREEDLSRRGIVRGVECD